jgi:GTP-binding protein EngB required for normal cell division
MVSDVTRAFDLVDLALGRAADIVDPELLATHAEMAANIRSRMGFAGRSVVVALVGGTGSGKSSILNALAGERVARTGVRRPTTEQPLAWIPANPEPGLIRLLDELGIDDRVGHESFGDIALLDLPDTDSVVGSHRAMVEFLLPRVDAVAWVLDPEKYNDRLIHHDFLQPLAVYSSQFLFVLNQVDRLTPTEEAEVIDDLRRVLAADGIAEPQLIAVAADPTNGPPLGVARLSRDLRGRFDAKQLVMMKVIADLRQVRTGIAEATGVGSGEGTSYDDRWTAVAESAAATIADSVLIHAGSAEEVGRRKALATGGGPVGAAVGWFRSSRFSRTVGASDPTEDVHLDPGGHLTRAGSAVTELVSDLSFETGGSFGRLLRSEVESEKVDTELARVVEAASLEAGEFEVSESSPWWRAAAVVQWIVALAFLTGTLLIWADPSTLKPGEDIRPLSLIIGSVVIGLAVRMLVVDSGHRAGERALSDYRNRLCGAVRIGMDRRIGSPIRALMRSRAEVAGALSELGLVTAALENDLLTAGD